MPIRATLLFVLMLALSVANAKQQSDTDYRTIRDMEIYTNDAVGIAGLMPEPVRAFRRLVEKDDAAGLFKRLLQEARPAGQLYALCGLYFTDHAAFETALPQYQNSRIEVRTQFGCIVGQEKTDKLVSASGPQVMRLQPGQSPSDWLADHPQAERDGYYLDISGGGFCHLIRGTSWNDKQADPGEQ